ncbi:hypothetical protein BRC93_04535 [Halobacteriales archaeon QS_5_70_15]|nr:MAG: hypothetical protein BRC93_04535 [Halobacteriales archaeon QS_5_70_15]
MVDVRSVFFGTKLKAIVTALGLLGATVGGAFAAGVLGAPSVVGVENQFGEVSRETTLIETDLVVTNPNPIGVQLGGATVNYTVTMNDVEMASGYKKGLAIERGNSSLHFTTRMRNEKIPAWWVSHIENGERTRLDIDARVHSSLVGQTATVPHSQEISTNVIGQFNSTERRPVNANRPGVSDPVLYINRTGASWGSVTRSETPIDMRFVVYNPKTTPYTVTEVGYEILMNDVSVGAGATDRAHVVPGGTEESIRTTTAIRNAKLDEWWVSHLRNDQVTQLRIDFYARIELPTGNTIRVPLEELTYTKQIETDIFRPRDEGADRSEGAETTAEPRTARPGAGVITTPNGTIEAPTVSENSTALPTPTAGENGFIGNTTNTTATPTDDGGPLDIFSRTAR